MTNLLQKLVFRLGILCYHYIAEIGSQKSLHTLWVLLIAVCGVRVTNLRVAGCGRLKSTVCGVTNLRSAGCFKTCGVREVSKRAGCGSLKQACNLSQLL